ncbi:hypothetical protein P879_10819 [Paragonimus westermani]|uniref:Lamin-B receptor n=1 Tax=Paragonimus westermani TaxID=34504 RepID=A0A8T0DCA5_9TREM|nr:hypothetical protein P879_10819 [Paragonimus westermani]
MPAKKTSRKSRSSAARERSKSVGRPTSQSRGRAPARSRSRSRSRTTASPAKRSKTPASESKIRRRRSLSSNSSSSSFKETQNPSENFKIVPDASGEKRVKTILTRDLLPSRFSRRIVDKQDVIRSQIVVQESSANPRSTGSHGHSLTACQMIQKTFREKICPSPILAFTCLATFLPFVYWLNFLVFTPAFTGPSSDTKVPYTIWGPAYRFLGVLWPIDFRIYFDYRCHGFVLAYLLLHFMFARFVPFGFRACSQSESRRTDYRCNGLFALVFIGGLFAFVQFCKLDPLPSMRPTLLLPKHWLSLMAATGNIAVVGALIAHFASRRLPRSQLSSEGHSGNFFVDFWVGRALRPRWLGLDWKMVILRPGAIGLLLLEVTFTLAQWERFGRVSPALFALVVMHAVWIVDFFIFEHTQLFTFEVRHEGFGFFAIVGSLMVPFVYSIGASYLSSKPDVGRVFTTANLPDISQCFILGMGITLFLLGYWVYRRSNNQKDLFRRQPNHPAFAGLDKISGPHTQRLLAGGWWGFVRHPNYLGDLMMAFAQSLPSGAFSCLIFETVRLSCFLMCDL